MEREKFKSRLGFILLSAGCAIGLGNVWRFPYITGQYGGGIFVLFYVFFLIVVGVPVLTMEFAVGRASRRSTVQAYRVLEKPGQKWHLHGYVAMLGNYLLMMFYTVVAGWMLYYFYQYCIGGFVDATGDSINEMFGSMLASPGTLIFWMVVVVVLVEVSSPASFLMAVLTVMLEDTPAVVVDVVLLIRFFTSSSTP